MLAVAVLFKMDSFHSYDVRDLLVNVGGLTTCYWSGVVVDGTKHSVIHCLSVGFIVGKFNKKAWLNFQL